MNPTVDSSSKKTTLGVTLDTEFDIEFLQKKIEDLRQCTLNNKRKCLNTFDDEKDRADNLQKGDEARTVGHERLESLRVEIAQQRNRNDSLEQDLLKTQRELEEMDAATTITMKKIHEERKTNARQTKKLQKELDDLNNMLFGLPSRFSREKLQAEVSAIRSESHRVQNELSTMRSELETLKDRLDMYPSRDFQTRAITAIAEEELLFYEQQAALACDDVGRSKREALERQILEAEAEARYEARQQLILEQTQQENVLELPTHDSDS